MTRSASNLSSARLLMAAAALAMIAPNGRPVRGESDLRLPVTFEPNHGQADTQVRYLSRGPGYGLFLTDAEAVHVVQQKHDSAPAVVRMSLDGGQRPAAIEALDPLPHQSHYFSGRVAGARRISVPNFTSVRYDEVYPGVDLVYRGGQPRFEYDFLVAAGANPSVIRMRFDGATDPRVDAEGTLVLRAGNGDLRHRKPVSYQDAGGERREVASSFVLHPDGSVGFDVGAYDRTKALVIDPVLIYSTYLGGRGNDLPDAAAITVDGSGAVYVTGATTSPNFPVTPGAFQTTGGGTSGFAGFVTKFAPGGSALMYSTYISGAFPTGIAVDAAGAAYITGYADADLPTTPGAFDRTCTADPTASCFGEAFVTKLNATGSALVYSTYIGANHNPETRESSQANDIALDSAGHVYVSGRTGPNFPVTAGAFQPIYGGEEQDGFVVKMHPSGGSLVYASFMGGVGRDEAYAVAVDQSGAVFVAGVAGSPDFPTTPGAFQQTCLQGAPDRCSTAFVMKVSPAGSGLVYSTFLGAEVPEPDTDSAPSYAFGLDIDSAGHAYVTGVTDTAAFPTTAGAFQTTCRGGDAFVTKLRADGSGLVYSTCLGGNGFEAGLSIAVDPAHRAYVTGQTMSLDFPVVDAIQPAPAGGFDAFVSKLSADGSALIYSTYLGGAPEFGVVGDMGFDIATDAAGDAYVIGRTASLDFPTVNAFQPAFGGGDNSFGIGRTDAFVARIGNVCGEDVTDKVDLLQDQIRPFFFTPLRFQWIFIRNRTADPIIGPLSFVMEDLLNAVFIGTGYTTYCFSPSGTPFGVLSTGDGVLAPGETRAALVWFFKTTFSPTTYTPRILSGVPRR